MKFFTIKELCHSDTAKQRGIDNTPTAEVISNLTNLVNNLLDPLRERFERPIHVSSGYRSAILNRSINGATSSQHRLGEAVDITVGSKEENKKLYELIRDNLPYDQLINEHDFSWVHVSYREGRLRKQELKIG